MEFLRQICYGVGKKQQNSWPVTSKVLANFVVLYPMLHKWLAIDITANSCVEEWRFLVGWCSVVQVK